MKVTRHIPSVALVVIGYGLVAFGSLLTVIGLAMCVVTLRSPNPEGHVGPMNFLILLIWWAVTCVPGFLFVRWGRRNERGLDTDPGKLAR